MFKRLYAPLLCITFMGLSAPVALAESVVDLALDSTSPPSSPLEATPTLEALLNTPDMREPINPAAYDAARMGQAILHATNLMRAKHKLPLFFHSPALEKAAYDHSKAMSKHNFFSHTSVIKGSEKMSQRLAKVGITNAYSAENIAQASALNYTSGKPVYSPKTNGGYFSYEYKGTPLKPRTYADAARKVVKQWMDSPGHRRNILNPRLKYLGAGLSLFEKKSFYNMLYFNATQNFSSKKGSL